MISCPECLSIRHTVFCSLRKEVITPEVLWKNTSSINRIAWLKNHGFKTLWSTDTWFNLPQYIQIKWESQS